MGVEGTQSKAFMFEKPTILQVGNVEVIVPRKK